jgi:hypothetical protein
LDFAASIRNTSKTFWLCVVSWLWFVFSAFSPIYILYTIDFMMGDDKEDKKELMWSVYGVVIGLIIPSVSIGFNYFSWQRYMYTTTREGKVAEEGEAPDRDGGGWFDSQDCESVNYDPPSVHSSPGDSKN